MIQADVPNSKLQAVRMTLEVRASLADVLKAEYRDRPIDKKTPWKQRKEYLYNQNVYQNQDREFFENPVVEQLGSRFMLVHQVPQIPLALKREFLYIRYF